MLFTSIHKRKIQEIFLINNGEFFKKMLIDLNQHDDHGHVLDILEKESSYDSPLKGNHQDGSTFIWREVKTKVKA